MSETCQKHIRNISETYQKHIINISEPYQKHSRHIQQNVATPPVANATPPVANATPPVAGEHSSPHEFLVGTQAKLI